MKDLFVNVIKPKKIVVNLYADEVQEIECPYTKDKWIYIGLIVERLDKPLLNEIISIRYLNNFDINAPYFEKNDRIYIGLKYNLRIRKTLLKDGLNLY
jgi:hypothetical protein